MRRRHKYLVVPLPMLLLSVAALSVLLACASAWEKTQERDTIRAYEEFLQSNADSPYRDLATTRLAELHWEQAKQQDSVDAYRSFVARFPSSAEAPEARASIALKIETEDWREARERDSLEGYRTFLREHSAGHFASDAARSIERKELEAREEAAYVDAARTDSVAGYRRFLEQFPEGAHVPDVKAYLAEVEPPLLLACLKRCGPVPLVRGSIFGPNTVRFDADSGCPGACKQKYPGYSCCYSVGPQLSICNSAPTVWPATHPPGVAYWSSCKAR